MTRLNTWQRRALAARGLDPAKVGVPMNTAATLDNKSTPQTAADFEDWLKINCDTPEKVAKLVNDGTFASTIKGYKEALNSERENLGEQVREMAKATLMDLIKNGEIENNSKRLNLDPSDTSPSNKYQPIYNSRALGAKLDGMFNSKAEFFQAVWHNGNKSAEVREKLETIRNYSEKVPSEGGLLVPEEFRSEILSLALERSVVRPRATVVQMGSLRLHFPAVDETSRVGSVFGGITVYRTEEGAELTETEGSFASIKLEVTKQTALAHVTNELVRDWGGFTRYIEQSFPAAMASSEDADFLGGTGTGEPLGALSSQNPAMITVAKQSGQSAATIVWENVLDMYSRMLPESLDRAVWVVTPDAFPELATMAMSVGTGGSAIWINNGVSGPPTSLLGRPVILSSRAPGLKGTQGDISLVDFGYYLIGDRQMMTLDSSPHVKFTSDKTTFRLIARNDGRPSLLSALTPENNGPTQSAFVQLATRA
jgi:HK97 family phage major capsid protein